MLKLSIIIPVYNSEKTVRRCLDSVMGQSYYEWELIVVDDGSNDGSRSILKEYTSDRRVKLFFQFNSGPGAARNKGIKEAVGDYIIFIDSDDYIEKEYFKEVVSYIEGNYVDVLFIDLIQEAPNGTLIKYEKMSDFKRMSKSELLQYQMTGKMPWGGVRKVANNKFLKENNICFSDNKVAEEALYSFKLIYYSDKVGFLEKFCYHYINYEKSQSKAGGIDPWGNAVKEIRKFLKENELEQVYESAINGFDYTSRVVVINRVVQRNTFFDAIKILRELNINLDLCINKKYLDYRIALIASVTNNIWVYFAAANIKCLLERIRHKK